MSFSIRRDEKGRFRFVAQGRKYLHLYFYYLDSPQHPADVVDLSQAQKVKYDALVRAGVTGVVVVAPRSASEYPSCRWLPWSCRASSRHAEPANHTGSGTGPGPRHRLRVCTLPLIFLVAFLIRGTILFSGMTPQQWIRPETKHETGRVARTLYESGRFADPYVIPTGPTAHTLPLNTLLQAILYEVFGFTLAAGYARCLIHIAAYSMMYALIPWLAERMGAGRGAGVIGGLAGALVPYQSSGEVIGWTSNEPLAAIALGLSLAALVRRWQAGGAFFGKSLCIGIGFGVGFHFVPALLVVWLGCLAFEVWWARGRHCWSGSAAIVLGTILACAPWTLRNYAAFGEFVFIRSNFGLELRMGNHEGATSEIDAMDRREGDRMKHPGINLAEARLVQDLGEVEYMRRAQQESLTWIETHPAEFLRLTGLRFLHIWFGPWHLPYVAGFITALTLLAVIGAWRVLPGMSMPQRAAVLLPLVLFPLVYYIVVYMPRYRVPLDWILFMLAGAAIWPMSSARCPRTNPGGDSPADPRRGRRQIVARLQPLALPGSECGERAPGRRVAGDGANDRRSRTVTRGEKSSAYRFKDRPTVARTRACNGPAGAIGSAAGKDGTAGWEGTD